MTPEEYNYRHFHLDEAERQSFEDFKSIARVGEPAPTGTLVDAATHAEVSLADLWSRKHLIIEFGSFT